MAVASEATERARALLRRAFSLAQRKGRTVDLSLIQGGSNDSIDAGNGNDSITAPIATAPAIPGAITPDHLAMLAPAVVATVNAHPAIPAESKVHVAATIIDTLAQFMGPVFQVTRSSSRTQEEVALSVGMLSAILHAFA